jgi:hypothetical protein
MKFMLIMLWLNILCIVFVDGGITNPVHYNPAEVFSTTLNPAIRKLES